MWALLCVNSDKDYILGEQMTKEESVVLAYNYIDKFWWLETLAYLVATGVSVSDMKLKDVSPFIMNKFGTKAEDFVMFWMKFARWHEWVDYKQNTMPMFYFVDVGDSNTPAEVKIESRYGVQIFMLPHKHEKWSWTHPSSD